MKACKSDLVFIVALFFFNCNDKPNDSIIDNHLDNDKTELIAFGPYPNYYYNLANELNNNGYSDKAIEAYKNCISTSKSQTFIEDAMFNLSNLYFESQQDSLGYQLMDALIAKKYTWLGWYKNSDSTLLSKNSFISRLTKIDSIIALKENPNNSKFHYQDVNNFITAFQKSQSNWSNAPSYFYEDYFSKASKSLFYFQKFKIQSSSHAFAYRVEDKEKYFTSILPNLKKLNAQESILRDYFNKFEDLYPPAIFPDVYYVVGCFNAGGTSSPFGLILGAEMHSKMVNSDLSNFNNWEKKVVRDFLNLPLITIHELVHIQQQNNYSNLLGISIYEGAADFVSELICGSHINQYVHEWADNNETEVWEEFKKEMYGNNSSNWIGNADRAIDKPADLGYYIGYKICESYYNKQSDKTKAINDILTITNWDEFFQESGYMQQ